MSTDSWLKLKNLCSQNTIQNPADQQFTATQNYFCTGIMPLTTYGAAVQMNQQCV
jgi:hypothetical protein